MSEPEQFLQDATDQFVANLIENNEATKFLCSSFRIPLKFAINLTFYGKSSQARVPTCTMDDIKGNIENAFDDLSNFYTDGGNFSVDSF
jgi:hypothetical protein